MTFAGADKLDEHLDKRLTLIEIRPSRNSLSVRFRMCEICRLMTYTGWGGNFDTDGMGGGTRADGFVVYRIISPIRNLCSGKFDILKSENRDYAS